MRAVLLQKDENGRIKQENKRINILNNYYITNNLS